MRISDAKALIAKPALATARGSMRVIRADVSGAATIMVTPLRAALQPAQVAV